MPVTDIVTKLEGWIKYICPNAPPDTDSLLADLAEAVKEIKHLRDPSSPYLDANYSWTIYGFRLWIEPIEKEFWDDATRSMIYRKAYAIKAIPDPASGYFAYAYKNERDACEVAQRMCDKFDVQVYRVNFSADGNPVGYRDELSR